MPVIVVALALGCSSLRGSAPPSLPEGVPAEAARIALAEGALTLDGASVVEMAALSAEPTLPSSDALIGALSAQAGRPLWVALPPDMPFWTVRQVLGSAAEAGTGGVWLSADAQEAFAVTPSPRFGIGGSCPDGETVAVRGVEPLVTVSIQTGADGAWVLATARFVPVTDGGPTDGIEPECLSVPPCEELYPDGPEREACAGQALPAPQRVVLGGERGCLLPIAREPQDVARWRPELARLIGVLGLGDRPLRVVMPEARSRLDAVLAVLGGFVDAGLEPPAIGTALLVEGNDGPPVCNAPVRDRAALAEAGARWLGGMRAWASAPPVEDGAPTDGAPDGE